jgi:CheY-like chemotaxis protein
MDAHDNYAGPRVRINGTILVAEDGIDNQALIAAKLRETGLQLEIAPNGQIAYDKALAASNSGKPYDLILMDVQMPVMDGFTATLNLRGKGYRGPIIALTANAMDRDRSKCLSAGCNDFVTKPISMEKLFKAISKYLTVTPIAATAAPTKEAPDHAALAQKFYEDLPTEIEQIEQAIVRKDRVLLKEIAQLILGKAATAGLKEVAPQAAKLMQSAETEQSWLVLREAIIQFAKDTEKPQQQRAAA